MRGDQYPSEGEDGGRISDGHPEFILWVVGEGQLRGGIRLVLGFRKNLHAVREIVINLNEMRLSRG